MKGCFRWIVILAVVLIAAVGLFSLLRGQQQPDAETVEANVLDESVVVRDSFDVTVSGTGTLLPARQIPLFFELNATVVEVLAESGDAVREGDVIARVDAVDLQAALDDAELAVRGAQLAYDALTAPPREVDIAVAEAALNAARASYNAATQTGTTAEAVEIARLQIELARNQLWQTQLQSQSSGFSIDLSQIPGIEDLPPEVVAQITQALSGLFGGSFAPNPMQTQVTLTQLEQGIGIAEANYTATQNRGPDYGALNAGKAGVTQAQIALDRLVEGADTTQLERAAIELEQARLALEQAQSAVKRAEIVAPFEGTVTQNNLVVGQLPPTREAPVILMDLSVYYVELPIDETDVTQVAVGQPVTLTLDALPGVTLTGVVERVSQTPTNLGQLVTYLARVRLDPTDEPLRIGMSATARIITRQVENALLVRNNFVRVDRTTQQTFITLARADNTFEEIEVQLGARNETFSEVVSELNEGDRVVLLPTTGSGAFGFSGPPGQ